jgi:hypothetical protein
VENGTVAAQFLFWEYLFLNSYERQRRMNRDFKKDRETGKKTDELQNARQRQTLKDTTDVQDGMRDSYDWKKERNVREQLIDCWNILVARHWVMVYKKRASLPPAGKTISFLLGL